MRTVAAVLLASGFARRFGRPKQEAILGSETLLARAVRTAQEAGLTPVVAVVREAHWLSALPGATVLINEHAAEGIASALRLGIGFVSEGDAQGAIVMTCDQPLLTPNHLHALCALPDRITASGYNGRKGVPAYFPASAFASLESLRGDAGARRLLAEAAVVTDDDLALDIDTEDDLRRACEILAQRA